VAVKNNAILFFLSAILILHPVLPYIEYYAFKEYIVENLCINRNNPKSCCEGKCYLEKRIKENNSENQEEKQNSVAPQLKRIEYNLPEKNNVVLFELDLAVKKGFLIPNYHHIFFQTVFHPPQA